MNRKWIIFFGLLLVFGIVAFSANNRRNEMGSNILLSVTPSPDSSPTQIPTETVSQSTDAVGREGGLATREISLVTNFYDSYLDCMKNPPNEATGRVSEYCISHNEYASSTLPQNLEEGGVAMMGADPITCTQNPPESIEATSSTEKEGGLTGVIVQEVFGSSKPLELTADVQQENGDFKVVNIHCPHP